MAVTLVFDSSNLDKPFRIPIASHALLLLSFYELSGYLLFLGTGSNLDNARN